MIDVGSPDARARLATALGVPRWIDEVVSGGPYSSIEDLLLAATRAAARLTDAELDEAVAADRGTTGDAGEQAGLDRNDEGDGAAIARGDEVYEQRFGRPLVIDAAGRSRKEVLEELQRRLKNDDETEAAEAKEQLARIAATRLRALFAADA